MFSKESFKFIDELDWWVTMNHRRAVEIGPKQLALRWADQYIHIHKHVYKDYLEDVIDRYVSFEIGKLFEEKAPTVAMVKKTCNITSYYHIQYAISNPRSIIRWTWSDTKFYEIVTRTEEMMRITP